MKTLRDQYAIFRNALGLLIALIVCPCHAAFQFVGDVQSVIVAPDMVDMRLAQGAVARVELPAADVARVRFSPGGSFSTRVSGALAPGGLAAPGAAIYDTPGVVYMVTAQMTVMISKAPFQVTVLRPDGSVVVADANYGIGWDSATGLIINRKYTFPDEHFFGMGLRGGPIDRRGRAFFNTNRDLGGYLEFSDPLYSSTPFYYGMRNGQAYGVFLDNPAMPFFDFDSAKSGEVTFGAFAGELDYYVLAGPQPTGVSAAFAQLTGYNPLPPKWTMGYHQSRYGYKSQAELLNLATTFRQNNIPCDALYLDLDYMNRQQLFSWDPVNFPTPQSMNATLEASGFKRVNIIDPALRTDDLLWPYFSGSGFFVTDAAGTPLVNSIFLGNVSWIDFTKNSTRTFYSQQLKVFLGTGISAVWNDLNEPAQNYMPEAIYDFNGEKRTDLEARDLYALQETSLTYTAQKELRPNVRPWVLSRSGYPGIQRYAANWSGDTLSTFDSLRVSVQISLSMGLSGQNQFGHDVGGFLGSPSPELFIRWLEFGSFTPYFRNHALNTSQPREPWQFGEPYTTIARNVINQRYRLMPYLYTLFEQASRQGTPVLAPTFYYFPADPGTYAQDGDFMLGPSLLVAPVVTAGAATRSVYLPAGGNWLDYYSGVSYAGGQIVTVAAPLERIPLFVRAGAIIPGGPVMQYVSEPVAPLLTADIYPGPDAAFTLYEDDGASFDYSRGNFLRTQLSSTVSAAGTQFSIQRIAGGWLPPARPWKVYFHGIAAMPVALRLNGVALASAATEAGLDAMTNGWYYRAADSSVIAKVQDTVAPLNLSLEK